MGENIPERKTRVIAVGNQKGGVGKTTNCIHLAGALAERGRLSLIIDLDMTAGATSSLRAPTEGWVDTFEFLTGAEPLECIITEEEDEVKLPRGIHLIPSSVKLAELDNWLGRPENQFVVLQDLLLEPLKKLRGRYDYIWLDTPPQYTKTMIPALKAADFALLSAMPDQLAVKAIGPAVSYILQAQAGPNPDLIFLGAIINAMPRPMTQAPSSTRSSGPRRTSSSRPTCRARWSCRRRRRWARPSSNTPPTTRLRTPTASSRRRSRNASLSSRRPATGTTRAAANPSSRSSRRRRTYQPQTRPRWGRGVLQKPLRRPQSAPAGRP